MINWHYFPRSAKPTTSILQLVQAFESLALSIDSSASLGLDSNAVLKVLKPELEKIGYLVECGKSKDQKILVPVLFGLNGKPQKSFNADAYNKNEQIVLEVEAGRGVANNQFLKDLFQACMMTDVDYLAIAVLNQYGKLKDFETVVRYFDTLYASNRLHLPLKGILLIGY